MILDLATISSPIGSWTAAVHDGKLVALGMARGFPAQLARLERRFGVFETRARRDPGGVATALARYFRGDVAALDTVTVDAGGTPFQRRVWKALRAIPAGTTSSYAALARRLGVPDSVRAVGHANAVNPVAIVVPCHRVVGSDGALRGYAFGLERKQWLLDHEARLAATARPRAAARGVAAV